ncbi:MAG: tetratricopeptide repeat protein [candidate division Zixibacteria bacterium]|nr:tetratricopeptide repeat protein [candidate division Zixibacteria bacterium]
MGIREHFLKPHIIWATGLTAAALIIRIVYLVQSSSNSPFFYNPSIDALYHHLLAVDIANRELVINGPFFRAPAYPFFLGIIYIIFDINLFIASLAGHLLGIAIVVFIFAISYRYFNLTAAIIASLLYILYFPPLYFEGKLLVDTLFSFFTIVAVYLILRGVEDNSKIFTIAIAGFALGLAAVTRANILLFCVPVIIFVYFKTKNIPKTVVFIAVSVIPILPVTAVNYFLGNDTVLIASQGGINFYIGNNKAADGMTANMPEFGASWEYEDCEYLAEKETGRQDMKPSEVSSFYYSKGLSYWAVNPIDAVGLALKKAYLSINNFEISNNQNLYFSKRFASISRVSFIPFAFILGLAVIGNIITGFRDKNTLLLWMITVSLWLTMILFFVTSRFRLPFIPYLSIFAGYGLYKIYSGIESRNFPAKLIIAIALGILAFVISITNFTGIDKDNYAQAYYNLGNIYLRGGNWEDAREYYHDAAGNDSEVAQANLNLGNIHFYNGDYDSAVFYYKRELKFHPGEARAYLNLSTIELLRGNHDQALDYAEKSMIVKPNMVPAALNIVQIYMNRGDTTAALQHARRYCRQFPDDINIQLALGKIFQQTGRTDSAGFYYRQIIESDSKNLVSDYNLGKIYSEDLPYSSAPEKTRTMAMYNLAAIEIDRKNFDTALDLLNEVVKRDSLFTQAYINAGLIYDFKKDYTNAVEYLSRAVGIEPTNIIAVYNLALVNAKSGNLDRAESLFNKALQIDSAFAPALENLEIIRNIKQRH